MGLLWTGGRRGEGQSRGSSQEATAATVAPAGRSSRGFLYGGGELTVRWGQTPCLSFKQWVLRATLALVGISIPVFSRGNMHFHLSLGVIFFFHGFPWFSDLPGNMHMANATLGPYSIGLERSSSTFNKVLLQLTWRPSTEKHCLS